MILLLLIQKEGTFSPWRANTTTKATEKTSAWSDPAQPKREDLSNQNPTYVHPHARQVSDFPSFLSEKCDYSRWIIHSAKPDLSLSLCWLYTLVLVFLEDSWEVQKFYCKDRLARFCLSTCADQFFFPDLMVSVNLDEFGGDQYFSWSFGKRKEDNDERQRALNVVFVLCHFSDLPNIFYNFSRRGKEKLLFCASIFHTHSNLPDWVYHV